MANDTASTANAAPVPTATTSSPATTGPTRVVSWAVDWTRPLAAGRRSVSTTCGTMAFMAGKNSASAMPNTTPITSRCHSSARPLRASAARAPTVTPRAMSEARMSRRGGIRSASAPPTTMRIARGIDAAMRTVPRASPEPVRSRTSQARAIMWNWSPSIDTA